MDRSELQGLAQERLADAEALVTAGRYSGAYYLCGYAVETALKACIAKNVKEHEFPNLKTVQKSYSHDLTQLLGVAGLSQALETDMASNRQLRINWTIVKDWTEQSRYELRTQQQATDLIQAVSDGQNGVLVWVQQNW